MTLSSTVFFLLFASALTRADNQQIQQLCVNAATCLLADHRPLADLNASASHCLRSAFGAKRKSTGSQNRLNPSKMTPSRHRAHHNEIIEA